LFRELDMLDKNYIAGILKGIVGESNVMIDEPMKNHTSFRVGGPADILVVPEDVESLGKVVKELNSRGVPFFVMGNGTNLVVRDKGIRGVVIKLLDNFSRYSVKGDVIEAEAGILISKVSRIALEHGLTGLEFAEGIPGTLGGAIAMNAGAYNGEMKDVAERTVYMDLNGDIKSVSGAEHQFGKRTSFVQKEGGIVLKTELKLNKGSVDEIRTLMDEFKRRRKETQPLELPSAGSIFKRPEGYYTGKLVQDCGLRGFRIGGAEVSCKHCGFIVNVDNAKAEDIINLIKHIQDAVRDRFGVELQTEVKIIGEE